MLMRCVLTNRLKRSAFIRDQTWYMHLTPIDVANIERLVATHMASLPSQVHPHSGLRCYTAIVPIITGPAGRSRARCQRRPRYGERSHAPPLAARCSVIWWAQGARHESVGWAPSFIFKFDSAKPPAYVALRRLLSVASSRFLHVASPSRHWAGSNVSAW